MALTKRSTKGTALTHSELDANFTHLGGDGSYAFPDTDYSTAEKFIIHVIEGYVDFTEKLLIDNNYKDQISRYFQRNFNDGASGGERKKNELLQLLQASPKLVILDELDTGLDVDALKIILQMISKSKSCC